MTQAEWAKKLKDYHAAKVAADKAEALKDEIKQAMIAAGITRIEAGGFIGTLSDVPTTRFDGKAFRVDHADLYAAYTVHGSAKRFNLK